MRSLCAFQLWSPENRRARREGARYPHGAQEEEGLVDCTGAGEGGFVDTGGQHALTDRTCAWKRPKRGLGLGKRSTRSGNRKGGAQLDSAER